MTNDELLKRAREVRERAEKVHEIPLISEAIEFSQHARFDIPFLAGEVERLVATNKRLRDTISALEKQRHGLVAWFKRLVVALETIARAFDPDRSCIRMVDVDRAKVYGEHLGGKLRPKNAAKTEEPK